MGSERLRAAYRQAAWSEGVVLRARQSSLPRHRQAVLEHMHHFYLYKAPSGPQSPLPGDQHHASWPTVSMSQATFCPLCIEPLDETEQNFCPCPCG